MLNPSDSFQVREEDRTFYERELASFIPGRLFDAHTHLWEREHTASARPHIPDTVGLTQYRAFMEELHPGRRVSALFIPFPHKDHFLLGNEWVAKQRAADRSCRGLFFGRPEDDPEWVRSREDSARLNLYP